MVRTTFINVLITQTVSSFLLVMTCIDTPIHAILVRLSRLHLCLCVHPYYACAFICTIFICSIICVHLNCIYKIPLQPKYAFTQNVYLHPHHIYTWIHIVRSCVHRNLIYTLIHAVIYAFVHALSPRSSKVYLHIHLHCMYISTHLC